MQITAIKKKGSDTMPNLDRFAQGLPDSQNMDELAHCAGCDGYIYPGADVYVIDGEVLHADSECVLLHMAHAITFTTIEDALGVK